MSRDDHQQVDRSHADQSRADQSTEQPTDKDLPAGGAPALSLLQGVWGAKGQTSLDVDESCETGQCRASDQMGFDGLADEVEATTDRNKAINDLQSAWRTTLEREGKLDNDATSIRDLVLNSSDSES